MLCGEKKNILSMNCPDDPSDCYGVIQWSLSTEPNGGKAENCLRGIQKKGGIENNAYDLNCAVESSIVCEDISSEVVFRGLCPLGEHAQKKMSQIVEKVHNFLDPQDDLNFFEFGKKLIFDDPPPST